MGFFAQLGLQKQQQDFDKEAEELENRRKVEGEQREADRLQLAEGLFSRALGAPQQEQAGPIQQGDERGFIAGSGLLGRPNDPQTIAKFRQAGVLAGRKSEELTANVRSAQRVGSFENQNQQVTANRGLAQDFRKEIAPFRAKTQFFQDTIALGDSNKWTGTDDFVAIRNLLKQTLPNESVMGDDIKNLKFSQGVPQSFRTWISSLIGMGGLSQSGRKEILSTMRRNAEQANKLGTAVRENFQGQADAVPGLNTNFMLDQLEIPPLQETPSFSQEQIAAEIERRKRKGTVNRRGR